MTKPSMERRDYGRDQLRIPVELSHDGRFVRGEIENLSRGGARIHALESFQSGSFVEVEFEARKISQTFQRPANVVWTKESEMGIRFIPLLEAESWREEAEGH